MNDAGAVRLAEAIVMQAADDYRELKKLNKQSIKSKDEGTYSLSEIERFLKGKLCRTILSELHTNTTGMRILGQLKREAKAGKKDIL